MSDPDIRKEGFLRRLKTLKRRYFVLRSVSTLGQARLEYYESDKKFRGNIPPKRVIKLASCFSISRKEDTKQKFAFVLYTREDVFGLVAETDMELTSWLDALLEEKEKSEEALENDDIGITKVPIPPFCSPGTKRKLLNESQPAWQVIIKPRGLGTSKNLAGSYQLKLTNQVLSLISKSSENHVTEVQLTSIRRCGHTDCFFFMELGRSAGTGAGELWIQVDDPLLAQHMHEAILGSMHALSNGPETMRGRPQTATIKPRPTSLLFSSPVRSRSDTSPDSPTLPRSRLGSSSRDRHPSESESPKVSKPPILTRLLSGGKKKAEEIIHSVPKGRRFQSKSISVEPGHGSLLSRAQSADFSRMFSGLELQTPGSPDSAKDIDFEIIEPVRTMSNSSGSSGYSSGRSWDTQVKPTLITSDSDRKAENVIVTSSSPDDVTETEYVTMEAGDDGTLKKPKNDKVDGDDNKVVMATKDDDSSGYVHLTQREGTGYEDMSSDWDTGNTLTRETVERELVQNDENKQTPNSHLIERTKSSPKQKRTSQEGPSKAEIRELVSLRESPNASPRSTQKTGYPVKTGSPNASPRSTPNTGYPVKTGSPISSPRSTPNTGYPVKASKGSPGTTSRRKHEDYMQMNPVNDFHTYVNFKPGDALEESISDEPHYVNVEPPPSETKDDTEEPCYMNFRPGEPVKPVNIPTTEESANYMNVKPGGGILVGSAESPNYMNFCPVSTSPRTSSPKPISGNRRQKHKYENVTMDGVVKTEQAPEEPEYMNISPQKHKGLKHGQTLPSRMSTGGIPRPRRQGPRRRESEPAKGLSDEDAGMLFLDFSKKSKAKEEEERKPLNYISLDLSNKNKTSSPKDTRPSSINLSHSKLHKHNSDLGPKSAPANMTYSEIDFTKSQGLMQARLEKEKPKT